MRKAYQQNYSLHCSTFHFSLNPSYIIQLFLFFLSNFFRFCTFVLFHFKHIFIGFFLHIAGILILTKKSSKLIFGYHIALLLCEVFLSLCVLTLTLLMPSGPAATYLKRATGRPSACAICLLNTSADLIGLFSGLHNFI